MMVIKSWESSLNNLWNWPWNLFASRASHPARRESLSSRCPGLLVTSRHPEGSSWQSPLSSWPCPGSSPCSPSAPAPGVWTPAARSCPSRLVTRTQASCFAPPRISTPTLICHALLPTPCIELRNSLSCPAKIKYMNIIPIKSNDCSARN